MEPATTRQLWNIQEALRRLHAGGKSISKLREMFPTKEIASKAIEILNEADHSEAERINKLPVEQRIFASKTLSKEFYSELRKLTAKREGKDANQS